MYVFPPNYICAPCLSCLQIIYVNNVCEGEELNKNSCFVLILLSVSCLCHVHLVIMYSLCDNEYV